MSNHLRTIQRSMRHATIGDRAPSGSRKKLARRKRTEEFFEKIKHLFRKKEEAS